MAPSGAGNSEMEAFSNTRRSGIPVFIMATHNITLYTRKYSLNRSGSKPSLDDKLDKVFQMAEHVDARCVYMLDAASQRRRHAVAVR